MQHFARRGKKCLSCTLGNGQAGRGIGRRGCIRIVGGIVCSRNGCRIEVRAGNGRNRTDNAGIDVIVVPCNGHRQRIRPGGITGGGGRQRGIGNAN